MIETILGIFGIWVMGMIILIGTLTIFGFIHGIVDKKKGNQKDGQSDI